MKNIVTPIRVKIYENLLKEAGYEKAKTKFLVEGFSKIFSLGYEGPTKVKRNAPNLPLSVGTPTEIWNKVMTEVKAKRYAGPFKQVPFKYYIQSPIGSVSKDKGKKTRLIIHLSYPKTDQSVNSEIPHEKCSVKYPDFMDAVAICLEAGKFCNCAKSDISIALK